MNQSVKIATLDGSVYVYKQEEIEKIVKEKVQLNKLRIKTQRAKNGYFGSIDAGYQIGVGKYPNDRIAINIINGVRINSYFTIGGGIGLRYYTEEKSVLVPLTLNLKSTFIDDNFSPYFSVGFGYSLNGSNNLKGVGILLNPTFGIDMKLTDQSALTIGVGYEMQKYRIYYAYLPYFEYNANATYSAISLNIGISF